MKCVEMSCPSVGHACAAVDSLGNPAVEGKRPFEAGIARPIDEVGQRPCRNKGREVLEGEMIEAAPDLNDLARFEGALDMRIDGRACRMGQPCQNVAKSEDSRFRGGEGLFRQKIHDKILSYFDSIMHHFEEVSHCAIMKSMSKGIPKKPPQNRPVILYVGFDPLFALLRRRRLSGIRRCAVAHGWEVATISPEEATSEAVLTVLARQHVVGCVVECWMALNN